MHEEFFAGQWPLICQGVRSHAVIMSRHLSAETAALLAAQTERFCGQPPPADAEQLVARMVEQAAFASRASLLAHADEMARLCPAVAAEVLAVAREACEPDLPASPEEAASQSLAVTHAVERVSLICHEDAVRRLAAEARPGSA